MFNFESKIHPKLVAADMLLITDLPICNCFSVVSFPKIICFWCYHAWSATTFYLTILHYIALYLTLSPNILSHTSQWLTVPHSISLYLILSIYASFSLSMPHSISLYLILSIYASFYLSLSHSIYLYLPYSITFSGLQNQSQS